MAIFKKRNKWWIGYRNSDGKWRREAISTSHSLAVEVLSKRKAQVAEEIHFPARAKNKALFSEIAKEYWTLHGQYLRSSKTYDCMLKKILAEFGNKKIGNISPACIQKFCNEIVNKTSASTANRYRTLLQTIFNKAKVWGKFYGDNPCCMVKKQKEPNHRLRYLNEPEIKRLIEYANPKLIPILACALMTGMRKGEILNLNWQDVNLERNIIYILQSKSGKPREIPIIPALKRVFLSLNPADCGNVFKLSKMSLRRYFDKAMKQADITEFRFHDLRHTFASHFMMRDGNIMDLQKILGHSSLEMTLRYAHLSRKHLSKSMDRLNGLMDFEPKKAENTLEIAPPVAPLRNFGFQNVVK